MITLMKRFLLFVVVSLFINVTYGRKLYQSTFRLSYEAGIGSVKNNFIGGEYVGDFMPARHWLVGLGFGAFSTSLQTTLDEQSESAVAFPLFIDAKYKILADGVCKPFIMANLGYSFLSIDSRNNEDTKLGVFLRVGVGAYFKVGKGDIALELYYKEQQQKVSDHGIYLNDFSNIGFSIGYAF